MHPSTAARSLLALAVLTAIAAACASPKQPFRQRWHREAYAIETDELKKVSFYISTEVLAQQVTEGGEVSADSVILLPKGTAGVVLDAGPNWVRVSFEEGGSGAPFLASGKPGEDSFYWLATEVPGESGYTRLKDLREPILRQGENAYRVMYGAGAYLLIGTRELEGIIATRRHLEGRGK
jgi:hypothetical protein